MSASPEKALSATLCEQHLHALAAPSVADFGEWHEQCKVAYIQTLMGSVTKSSLMQLSKFVDEHLKVDFVTVLPDEIIEKIFLHLDPKDVRNCALVSKSWHRVATSSPIWRAMYFQRVQTDETWQEYVRVYGAPLVTRHSDARDYFGLYNAISRELDRIKINWRTGNCAKRDIQCDSNGVYCIQYDDTKLVSGSRDNKIRVWDLATMTVKQTLTGHLGSVLCLQYDDTQIVTGSSDATARVWELATGTCRSTLTNHAESVLHLRFAADRLVTCSKDFRVISWIRDAPFSYQVARVLEGHTAAVNVVDFSDRYIVSASGDRTIRVWDTQTGNLERQIAGHSRGIACLHYRGDRILTGSSDETVRMWNVDTGQLIFTLRGHTALVRCLRFNDKYIISGSYDNMIIVWDVQTGERLATLRGHSNRVFRVQFDQFKIISSSQDDTIRIWDFAATMPSTAAPGSAATSPRPSPRV
eukprot:m.37397 g.37397  ORF g.37397 m.37397 type:complete len:470 (+) comp5443_c0_seq2:31-1440(+)